MTLNVFVVLMVGFAVYITYTAWRDRAIEAWIYWLAVTTTLLVVTRWTDVIWPWWPLLFTGYVVSIAGFALALCRAFLRLNAREQ